MKNMFQRLLKFLKQVVYLVCDRLYLSLGLSVYVILLSNHLSPYCIIMSIHITSRHCNYCSTGLDGCAIHTNTKLKP